MSTIANSGFATVSKSWRSRAGIWLIAIAGAIIGCTWLFHILAPVSWHWLDADAVGKLQNIFTGGVLVSAVGDHWRRRMR